MFAYLSVAAATEGIGMDTATGAVTGVPGSPTDEWCCAHFDHLSPDLAAHLHPTLARMRDRCPIAHSDQYGGYWIFTRYEDVLTIAQDWQTFSSAHGVSVPGTKMVVPAIPEHLDPPLHRIFKRLINSHLTPAVVSTYERPTRELVTDLIDRFIESGECDFMSAFARPFPGRAFFELVLHAPPDEVEEINDLSTRASVPTSPGARECWQKMNEWIVRFVEDRRRQPPRGDVVDAILEADIEGRPITETEILGTITLLILGGLDTTSGALGHFMMRFSREPSIPRQLREQPDLIPAAVEELLRLEGPFLAIARTAMQDTEVSGQPVREGEKVMIYWASANRDEAAFPDADQFDLGRARNPHLTFGAGPHRCAGSHLARLNLRVALEELTRRLNNVSMTVPEEAVPFHSALNRSPLSLPIRFEPGAKVGRRLDPGEAGAPDGPADRDARDRP
jgi:cytochrome P450